VLISYEGQPVTCYGCGGQGHTQQACPKRRREVTMTNGSPPTSWARVLSQRIHDGANAELGGDVMTYAETWLQPQAQQLENTDMGGTSEYPQSRAVPDDKEDQHEKTASSQTANDDMPTGLPIRDPSPNGNTNDRMEPALNLFKEQEKHDWSQLMQEEEDGSSAMVVEEDSPEQSSLRKAAPTRGTGKSTGEGESDVKEENATSRPKKLKLGTGSERRTDRQRSRSRQTINKKEEQ